MSVAARYTAPVVLPCDALCTVLRDGVVDVEADGRIGHVGAAAGAPPPPRGAGTTALSGILMPGLVNAHAHSPMTVLRGAGGDLPLMPWLQEVVWPAEGRLRAPDVKAGMLLGCVEMLRAGVTTSVEMYFYSEQIVEAVLAAGSRAVVTPGIIAVPGWDRLGTWQQMLGAITKWIEADGLRFGPGERVELGYGPHAAYTLPPEALAEVAAQAREHDALMHIHVAESPAEDEAQRAGHGSVPLLLEELGALGGRVLAAHGVHLSDEDIALFARRGVAVAHCPGSNAKLASGIARVAQLLTAGVRVGLGTDGPASNDDLDLWEEVRLAALLARLSAQDAAAMTAAQALLLATRCGAAVDASGLPLGEDLLTGNPDVAHAARTRRPHDVGQHLLVRGVQTRGEGRVVHVEVHDVGPAARFERSDIGPVQSLGPAAGRGQQRRTGGQRRRVAGDRAGEHPRELHLLPQVQVVVAGRPIGAEPYRHARREQVDQPRGAGG